MPMRWLLTVGAVLTVLFALCTSFILPPPLTGSPSSPVQPALREPQSVLAAGKGFGKPAAPSGRGAGSASDAILTVPFKDVKIGALKMFISLWVMGQEDWSGNEVQSGVIAAVHDATQGSVLITLSDGSDASLSVSRAKDSTLQYRLQEALLLHRLLDELEDIMSDKSIADDKRVFTLPDASAIDAARSTIPARQA